MNEFFQLILAGIAMGFVYALMGLSIALIYNAAGTVSFAQGALVMLGAYVGVTVLETFHLSYQLALPAAIIIMGVIGWGYQRFIYYPLRYANRLMFIIAGIGFGIFLENIAINVWGAAPLIVRPMIAVNTFKVGGLYLEPQLVAIVIITGCILLLEQYFLRCTMLGKMTQAVAQDKDAASLMGINVGVMIAITFINSTILAGIAGILIAPIFYVTTGLSMLLPKAFATCVVGGFGNTTGTILGGVIIGLTEAFGARYISPVYRDAWAFVFLILFLFFRPQGIFRERIGEKV